MMLVGYIIRLTSDTHMHEFYYIINICLNETCKGIFLTMHIITNSYWWLNGSFAKHRVLNLNFIYDVLQCSTCEIFGV